jgi:hypothetical protein
VPITSTMASASRQRFLNRLRLVLCVSERSLLSVFVNARDRSSFTIRFKEQVRAVLESVGVRSYEVERETHEMSRVALGAPVSRRTLGSLSDFALPPRLAIEDQSELELTSLAMKIADTLCSSIKYESPRSRTLAPIRDRGSACRRMCRPIPSFSNRGQHELPGLTILG